MENLIELLKQATFFDLQKILWCIIVGLAGALIGMGATNKGQKIKPEWQNNMVEDWGILVPISRGVALGGLIAFVGDGLLQLWNIPRSQY